MRPKLYHGWRGRLALLLLVSALACALAPPASATEARVVPGELVVGFEVGVAPSGRAAAIRRADARTLRRLGPIRALLVRVAPGDAAAAAARLRRDPRVRYVEPNYRVTFAEGVTPDDPFFLQLWGLDNAGQVVNGVGGVPDADIDAPEAWSFATGSPDVVVGVIDTGIDLDHPDLASRIWLNPGENCSGCRTDGVDNDANGYVDDWRGWDFVGNDNNPSDDNGHGTHVAGTIGAAGNDGAGVTGVAWDARLMPLKFLSASGSGTTANAAKAVLYAAENGARITNNSWNGYAFSQALLDAIREADAAGSLFVAAAGNDGVSTDAYAAYPSSYEAPNVVSVAATDASDLRASFSNYGPTRVDLGAPGVNVYSTWAGDSYRYASGTSMASPHVAGTAALLAARFADASAVGLKALLLGTVDANASLAGKTLTGGRLNAGTAAACADEPQVWIESPLPGFSVDAGQPVDVVALAGRCAEPGGVIASATANGTPLELLPRGDGLYAGVYTPSQGGALTVTVSASAGNATATRTVVGSATQTYPIVPGGAPVSVALGTPGEVARLTFAGAVGRRVSLALTDVTVGTSSCCSLKVSVTRPDGLTLFSSTYVGTKGGFLDTKSLPMTGTYTILVDPQGEDTGNVTLALYDVPPDAVEGLLPGGAPVTLETTVPGQNGRATFSGAAGQRVAVAVTDVSVGTSTCCSAKISILKPDGTSLAAAAYLGTKGGFVDTKALPVGGTYTILLDPQLTDTGAATLALYSVPPDVAGTLAVGGAPVSVTMATPGQNARFVFAGVAGQRVSLGLSQVTVGTSTCCSMKLSVVKPDGTSLLYPSYVGTRPVTLGLQLPVTGVYAIVLDPQGADTGSATVTLVPG